MTYDTLTAAAHSKARAVLHWLDRYDRDGQQTDLTNVVVAAEDLRAALQQLRYDHRAAKATAGA